MSKMLSPRQLAESLNVSLPTAYRLIASGEIGSITIGRSIRVRQSALDSYLERNEREGAVAGRHRRGLSA